jgi:alpha-galactosidase
MTGGRTHLSVGDGGITLCPDANGVLRQLGFGPAAADEEPTFPISLYPAWSPSIGVVPSEATAVSAQTALGIGAEFRFLNAVQVADERARTLLVTTVDQSTNVQLTHRFTAIEPHGLLAVSAEITNRGSSPITLSRYLSCSPLIAGTDPAVAHFGGGWAAEWTPSIDRIESGALVLTSRGSVQPHLHLNPAFLLFPDGCAALDSGIETDGLVFGALSSWAGNTRFEFHGQVNAPSGPTRTVRCLAGMSPENAPLKLDPNETLDLPEVLWGWSEAGVGDLSQRFHSWIATHRLRDPDRDRAIVWNNWEATGFDFDVRRLSAMVDDAAEMGAELFLVDDGWFGTEFPRISDAQGLGDWVVDPRRFPKGLAPLIGHTTDKGLRFGLWIEPEMVNPRSSLFNDHPEWVVRYPDRDPFLHRHQLVLDLCQPEVRGFVLATIERILAENPGISYLKWDANRPVAEPFSPAIEPDRMGEFSRNWSLAARAIMAEVAERHPEIELMLCASGGGRVDIDALRWFHEVWPSDNTDPVFRVRMQWAMSYFFPALVMGAHVTRWGDRPLDYACAVAMSGRFGFDLDPAALDIDERAVCGRATTTYRELSHIVQHGRLHRLISPFGRDHSALMYTHENDGAVVFGYQNGEKVPSGPLHLRGLDASAVYELSAVDLHSDASSPTVRRTGEELLTEGLWWPLSEPETAVIWRLKPAEAVRPPVIDLTE